jgi:hypothetical protein
MGYSKWVVDFSRKDSFLYRQFLRLDGVSVRICKIFYEEEEFVGITTDGGICVRSKGLYNCISSIDKYLISKGLDIEEADFDNVLKSKIKDLDLISFIRKNLDIDNEFLYDYDLGEEDVEN